MDKKLKVMSFSLLTMVGAVQVANAALVEEPLPSNAYITLNGLDWAWANPQPASLETSTFTLDFQEQFGWRLPTADELAQAPSPFDFIFEGANVPLGGTDPDTGAFFDPTNDFLTGDAACATPYFDTTLAECQWDDMVSPEGILYPWAGQADADELSEQLVVRVAGETPLPPEPTPPTPEEPGTPSPEQPEEPSPEKPGKPETPPSAEVPEPASLGLIGLGLAMLGLRRRH